MHKLISAGAAAFALALVASPAAVGAQDSMAGMSAEQHTMYMGWPANQRTDFDTWPADYRSYYWTLTPSQQRGYWRLTNEQRAQIAALTPEQRMTAWTSIEAQMAGMANRASPAQPMGDGMAATPATPSPMASGRAMATPSRTMSAPMSTGGNMTPPPASAMARDYPICSRTVTDGCQNPGEGGAPGRSRALKYWPGQPASEMRGNKPRM